MSEPIRDVIAIGLGPFNLSLACLAEPMEDLDLLVLDENSGFDWHPGLMMEDVRLQTPFLSDLVTMADPTSRYSVLQYLKESGRLYRFYVRENFFLLRKEYNRYCQWAAGKLSNLAFNRRVESVHYDDSAGCYQLRTRNPQDGTTYRYRARKLVLGTGPSPHVPACCHDLPGLVLHSADYLHHKQRLQQSKSITILGSGQSAAEIFDDLLQSQDQHDFRLQWITRSPRFFPLEYSKLTLEMTSPDYVDYFHNLDPATRDQLVTRQKPLYKGINSDLINSIHERLYSRSLDGPVPVQLLTGTALKDASAGARGRITLDLIQEEQQRPFRQQCDALVLATGYQYRPPAFLSGIGERIRWDHQGRFRVRRDYSIDQHGGEIFVLNAELHSHGFVAPDLGMACYRNSCILRALTGREPYPVESSVTFQQFGAPMESAGSPAPASGALS
ncbi:MAG: SidA/IucD/PvdA family monooxygenase [Oleiphilaceae bacterium]|nr:SidA/IucD/PvdA family monooxygenase [Oleiphilaceae bacterium]